MNCLSREVKTLIEIFQHISKWYAACSHVRSWIISLNSGNDSYAIGDTLLKKFLIARIFSMINYLKNVNMAQY